MSAAAVQEPAAAQDFVNAPTMLVMEGGASGTAAPATVHVQPATNVQCVSAEPVRRLVSASSAVPAASSTYMQDGQPMSFVGAPIGIPQQLFPAPSAASIQYTSPSVYNVSPEQFAIVAAGGKLSDADVQSITGTPNPVILDHPQAALVSSASSPSGEPTASSPGPNPDGQSTKSSSKSTKRDNRRKKKKWCC